MGAVWSCSLARKGDPSYIDLDTIHEAPTTFSWHWFWPSSWFPSWAQQQDFGRSTDPQSARSSISRTTQNSLWSWSQKNYTPFRTPRIAASAHSEEGISAAVTGTTTASSVQHAPGAPSSASQSGRYPSTSIGRSTNATVTPDSQQETWEAYEAFAAEEEAATTPAALDPISAVGAAAVSLLTSPLQNLTNTTFPSKKKSSVKKSFSGKTPYMTTPSKVSFTQLI